MSPNMVKFRKSQLQIVVDIRYPASIPYEEVIAAVNKMGVPYETLNFQPPLYHGKDSALVKTLSEVFEECTGQKAEPIAIGGGTYARALKNGVGFGPEFPGDEPVAHQPDEYILVERVGTLIEIYKKAARTPYENNRDPCPFRGRAFFKLFAGERLTETGMMV